MDYIEFSDLADELMKHKESAATRTAISRWYYASYHASFQFLEKIGIPIPDKDQHTAVMKRLINSDNMDIKSAGNKFKELKEYRKNADYDLDYTIAETPERVEKSKARSKSIIDYVIKDRSEGELLAIKDSINRWLSN